METHKIDSTKPDWWTLSIDSAYLGDTEISTPQYGIIDSGTSYIGLTDPAYEVFAVHMESLGFTDDNSDFFQTNNATCDEYIDQLPSLFFTLSNPSKTYALPPAAYMQSNWFGYKCAALVSMTTNSDDMIILGATFMRWYYVVFNSVNMTVSLAERPGYNYPISPFGVDAS